MAVKAATEGRAVQMSSARRCKPRSGAMIWERFPLSAALCIIVADNIAWNSSLWDYAEQYAVPA
jgi:hypothetical protein